MYDPNMYNPQIRSERHQTPLKPYYVINDPIVDFKTLGLFKLPKNSVVFWKDIKYYAHSKRILKIMEGRMQIVNGIGSNGKITDVNSFIYSVHEIKNTNKLSNPSFFSKLFSGKKSGGRTNKKMVCGKSVSAITTRKCKKSNKKRNKTERK